MMMMNQVSKFVSTEDLRSQQLAPLSKESLRELAVSTKQLQLQATLNIGMIGHVAHGKSSFVRVISGVSTSKHSSELRRNSTVQLGYANFKIFKCDNMLCTPPECYQSHCGSMEKPLCKTCGGQMSLLRHISFVDCPGHQVLMRTMLNGAAVMDAAVLVVAANEHVPQPQTAEHLVATEIMKLRNIITVQNKVDLVTLEQAKENKRAIVRLLDGSLAKGSPIIPISCAPKFSANIDVLLQYIINKIPTPMRDLHSPACLKIIRSFDVNKPGTPCDGLKGGVCGGSIERGVLRVGEIIEIRPGIIQATPDGKKTYTPIYTRVTALFSESRALEVALPGGLIGVGTTLDPVLTAKDRLVGQVLGRMDTLPDAYIALDMTYKLLKVIVGDESGCKVEKPAVGDEVLLTVGSASVRARVIQVDGNKRFLRVALADPVCAASGEKMALSRKVNNRFRLIGCCVFVEGKQATRKDLTW